MLRNIGLFIKKKLAFKHPQQRSSVPFAKAKKIGIISDNLNKNQKAINKLVTDLKKEGKEVEFFGYGNVKEIPKLNIKYKAFNKSDFTWMGRVKQDELKKFIKTDFDYLFSLNTSPFLPLDNILAYSKAKCRVGVFDERRKECFELMVQPSKKEDLSSVAEQMMRYTKLI